MSSALFQSNFTNSTTIVIALVVLVMAVGLMILLFARSSIQKREREGRVRERMLEMEREAPTLFVAGVSSWIPMIVFPAGFALMALRFVVAAFGEPPEPGHVDAHVLADQEPTP